MKLFRHNYMVLLLLGFLFAAPGISAYFFYVHPNWLSHNTTNKGTLLNPPILFEHDNSSTKWKLVLWSPNACEQNCITTLDQLARIRLALGRHLYKVDFQLLLDNNAPPFTENMVKAFKDQDIHPIKLSQEEREKMPLLKNHPEIFIVNPKDFVVLAYSTSVKSGDIFHDLKHLVSK